MPNRFEKEALESTIQREKLSDALEEQVGKETEDRLSTFNNFQETSEIKNFSNPDEVRIFPKGRLELITLKNKTIGRTTLQPGWKWTTSVKPIAQTESCLFDHLQYHISGVLKVKMDTGQEYELREGDISKILPGHDAWVVGDEPVVVIEIEGVEEYAKNKFH